MSYYRCFLLDRMQKIRAAEILECNGDEEAARAAQRFFAEHAAARAIEIWQRDRRIGVLRRNDAATR